MAGERAERAAGAELRRYINVDVSGYSTDTANTTDTAECGSTTCGHGYSSRYSRYSRYSTDAAQIQHRYSTDTAQIQQIQQQIQQIQQNPPSARCARIQPGYSSRYSNQIQHRYSWIQLT